MGEPKEKRFENQKEYMRRILFILFLNGSDYCRNCYQPSDWSLTDVISMDWSSRILNTFNNMEISGRNTNVHGFSSVLYNHI